MLKEQKSIKALSVNLRLLIPESDLNKIKQLKNPFKSKVFRTYSGLLLNTIKSLEMPEERSNKEEV